MRARTEGQIVEQRAGGVPIRHDRLTALEHLLLRTLYTVTMDWSTEDPEQTIGQLKEWSGFDDADCALLEQLLEEEKADRAC